MMSTKRMGVKCPIPNCAHVYDRGITGWFWHVATPENHPDYFPDVLDPEARRTLFEEDFPDFFREEKQQMAEIIEPARRRRTVEPLHQSADDIRCPLRGCAHVYRNGISGWEEHVGNWDNHPKYHAEIPSPKLRASIFKAEFPGWFSQAED